MAANLDHPTDTLVKQIDQVMLDEFGKRYFPDSFRWACHCGKLGFPGCDIVEHYATRVFTAIVDFHQRKETSHQLGLRKLSSGRKRLLKISHFSLEGRKKLDHDLNRAEAIIKSFVAPS